MTQQCQGGCGTRVVVFIQSKKEYPDFHESCERKTRLLAKGARKQGGSVCAQCGVQKPIPVSKWLRKMNWADGATFLLEQAKSLGCVVEFCVTSGWLRGASVSDAQNWLRTELYPSVLTLVNAEFFIRQVGDGLVEKLKAAARKESFFAPSYRGIIQYEVLDCARRLSIELCGANGGDLVLRPGGQYYAYLHSLSSFLYETKRKVTMEGICESIDTAYPEFDAQEKRLVFAFLLVREYARRLNRSRGKGLGISREHLELIRTFVGRCAVVG